MARPVKYKNDEERRQARLLQTRAAVLKLRARKREEAAAAAATTGEPAAGRAPVTADDAKVIEEAPTNVAPVSHRSNSSKPRRPLAILAKADDSRSDSSDSSDSSTSNHLASHGVQDADESNEQIEPEPQSTSLYNVVDIVGDSRRPVITGYPGFMRHMAYNLEVHSSFPFVSAIEDLGSSNRLAAVSVYAFGATITGVTAQDTTMLHKGTQAYRQVLRAMRALLVDSDRYKLAPLLPVIFNVLLLSVELTFVAFHPSPKSEQWKPMVHLNVLPAIVKSCGAEAFYSPLGVRIMTHERRLLFAVALYHKEPYAFDGEKWRKNPFLSTDPLSEDRLWCVIAKQPGLFHRMELAKAFTVQTALDAFIRTLWQDMLAFQSELDSWYNDFLAVHHHTVLTSAEAEPFWSDPHTNPDLYPCIDFAITLNEILFSTFMNQVSLRQLRNDYPIILSGVQDMYLVDPATTAWRLAQTARALTNSGSRVVDLLIPHVTLPLRILIRYFSLSPVKHMQQLIWCLNLVKQTASLGWWGRMSDLALDPMFPLTLNHSLLPDLQRPEHPALVLEDETLMLKEGNMMLEGEGPMYEAEPS